MAASTHSMTTAGTRLWHGPQCLFGSTT